MEYSIDDFTHIIVTGKHYGSNRYFKAKKYVNDMSGRLTAFSINIWNGSRWGLLPNRKRKLIQRIIN